MPETIEVDGLSFKFADGTTVSKYDNWDFYRNHFQRIRNGLKAVDLLVFHNDSIYLVEVKDYRQHVRMKSIDLVEEIAIKVLDSLAALVTAKCNSKVQDEQNIAKLACQARRIRVVLHIEQRQRSSPLFQQPYKVADIQQKLRTRLKPIDAHPIISQIANPNHVPWTVNS